MTNMGSISVVHVSKEGRCSPAEAQICSDRGRFFISIWGQGPIDEFHWTDGAVAILLNDNYKKLVLAFGEHRPVSSVIDHDDHLLVLGQRSEHGFISHMIVAVEQRKMLYLNSTFPEGSIKLKAASGEVFGLVGMPSKDKVYVTDGSPTPAIGWVITHRLECVQVPAAMHYVWDLPRPYLMSRLQRDPEYIPNSMSLFKNPGVTACLVFCQAAPLHDAAGNLPKGVAYAGRNKVSTLSTLVFAVTEQVKNVKFYWGAVNGFVQLSGFPEALRCALTSHAE